MEFAGFEWTLAGVTAHKAHWLGNSLCTLTCFKRVTHNDGMQEERNPLSRLGRGEKEVRADMTQHDSASAQRTPVVAEAWAFPNNKTYPVLAASAACVATKCISFVTQDERP